MVFGNRLSSGLRSGRFWPGLAVGSEVHRATSNSQFRSPGKARASFGYKRSVMKIPLTFGCNLNHAE